MIKWVTWPIGRLESINLRRNGNEQFYFALRIKCFSLIFKFKPLLPGTASCCKNDCNGLSHARARGWRWHKLCSGFCWSSSRISWRASETRPVSFRGECSFYNLPISYLLMYIYLLNKVISNSWFWAVFSVPGIVVHILHMQYLILSLQERYEWGLLEVILFCFR